VIVSGDPRARAVSERVAILSAPHGSTQDRVDDATRRRCKPPKVFCGWWVVVAFLLTALYAGRAVFHGFTTVFEPIADEMRWSCTQVTLGPSLLRVEAGLLAPGTGADNPVIAGECTVNCHGQRPSEPDVRYMRWL